MSIQTLRKYQYPDLAVALRQALAELEASSTSTAARYMALRTFLLNWATEMERGLDASEV